MYMDVQHPFRYCRQLLNKFLFLIAFYPKRYLDFCSSAAVARKTAWNTSLHHRAAVLIPAQWTAFCLHRQSFLTSWHWSTGLHLSKTPHTGGRSVSCLQCLLQGANMKFFGQFSVKNWSCFWVKLCFGYYVFIMWGTAGLSLAPVLAWQNSSVDLSKVWAASSHRFPSLCLGELHACQASLCCITPACSGWGGCGSGRGEKEHDFSRVFCLLLCYICYLDS